MAGFKMAIAEIEKNIPQTQLNNINFLQNHVRNETIRTTIK